MGAHLVTGAAGALGSAVVDTLLSRGDRVGAVDLARSSARLESEGARHGASYLAVPLPGSDGPAWTDAVAGVEHAFGPLEGAALVAGGWRGGAPLHLEDPQTFRAMLEMNLDSVYLALRALLPGMVARGRGSIVVVSSRAAVQPWTSGGAAAYAASKAAVSALVQAVSAEVLERGVRVNAVLPSVLDTAANRAAMPDADPSKWVTTASLAGVIAFLLSDAARDVRGALVPVYGGSLGGGRPRPARAVVRRRGCQNGSLDRPGSLWSVRLSRRVEVRASLSLRKPGSMRFPMAVARALP